MCGIQKNGTDELTGKTEIKIQMQRTKLQIPRREQMDGMNWETGINIQTLLYVIYIYIYIYISYNILICQYTHYYMLV